MGHRAALLLPVWVGACSFLYNPDHIKPRPDAMPDAMVDADPANLMLTGVESPPLREGQGDDGSRPAVLVVRGASIVNGATLTITPRSGTALIEVGAAVVSSQSDLIAVPVTARVDGTLGAGQTRTLDVKVTQTTPVGGTVEQSTTWTLEGLDELTGTMPFDTTATPLKEYSRVNVTTLNRTGNNALLIRAVAGITVANPINISASNSASAATPGPGGNIGGGVDGNGVGPGYGHAGAGGPTGHGGGGAGFVIMGGDGGGNSPSGGAATGDPLITRYAENTSSGGGGAEVFGGAGGGTIELTAGGNLSVAAITSNGSVGKNGVLSGGGGGGSGGVIVLRAGGGATLGGALTVSGAAGGTGGLTNTDGGQGRDGRARVDAVTITGSPLGVAQRGVMFDTTVPAIVRTASPMLHLLGKSGDEFDMYLVSPLFAPIGQSQLIPFGGADEALPTSPALSPGLNRICLVPKGGGLANRESRNCIDLAYLP